MNGIHRRLIWARLLFSAFRAGVVGPWSAVRLYRAGDFHPDGDFHSNGDFHSSEVTR